jgi:general secretion pathway protein A
VYTQFFGLNEKPFSITPDPRYLYLSQRHADALAHLIYGISESGGFIQLTGEVGTGKTTLIRSLLEQLPEKAEIALILNPQLSTREFLQAICQELGTAHTRESSVKELIDNLNAELLRAHAQGRRIVLIVDEAQNLSPEVLEQVRLLTNLETPKQKLLQIILIGQPELRDILSRSDMRQIAQRITGRYHLEPLSRDDTAAYLKHRMKVAGSQRQIFTPSAIHEIYRWSRGIPRIINVIADRALLAAYAVETTTVDRRLVNRAATEVFDRRPTRPWWQWAAVGACLAGLAVPVSDMWLKTERAELAVVSEVASMSAAQSGEPANPSLADLFDNPGFSTDMESALEDLFALWGARYEVGKGAACDQATEQDLRCLYQRGSISEVRRMNLPAILSLTGESGQPHQVVLSALGTDRAKLVSGSKTFSVDLKDLERYWYGDHLLLWRPVAAGLEELALGAQDESVRWLRETLAAIQHEEPGDLESSVYDAALEERLRAYQRARQLPADGVVGAETQIALTTDLGLPGTPLLTRDR